MRATGTQIEAFLDGVRMINYSTAEPARGGAFSLKAWGATARFSHAKVWARNVALSRPEPGVWIPYLRSTGQSSQGFPIIVADTDTTMPPENPEAIGRPLLAQQHGFNDCNNVIGEITSHSVFLSALMDVWRLALVPPLRRIRNVSDARS